MVIDIVLIMHRHDVLCIIMAMIVHKYSALENAILYIELVCSLTMVVIIVL